MAKILNIESSTDICSIGISIDGISISVVENNEPKVHTKMMTIMIMECMEKAGIGFNSLDAVAISAGPGSYTSLRIGAATAKAIAYAHKIPLISICTLKALAYSVSPKGKEKVVSMIDARRDEVYAAVYSSDHETINEPQPHIFTEDSYVELLLEKQTVYLVGNGAMKSKKWLRSDMFVLKNEMCSAKNMVKLSYLAFKEHDFVDIAYYTPNYIKGANITKSKKPLF